MNPRLTSNSLQLRMKMATEDGDRLILLSPFVKCWNYKYMPPYLVYSSLFGLFFEAESHHVA